VLNHLIWLADLMGFLQPLHANVKERAFFYADDVVLFSLPTQRDLTVIKTIPGIFANATGLQTNLSKCRISPIRCDLQATVTLLTNFTAKIDPFPITYLGIPLGIKKLKKTNMQPLIDKVTKRLPSWKANLLNKAGCSVLIKSTLSAIPTHTAVAIKISPWAIQCIDKICKGFLWSGALSPKNGHCLLA